MKNSLFWLALFVLYNSIAQDYVESPVIERTRKQNFPILIGEIDGSLFVQMTADYYEESDIYKLNEDLKIVSSGTIPVLYKPNRGGAAPTDVKKLICFGDKIISYYAIKEGKIAKVYYDVIDPNTFACKSEKNLLLSYTYPGAVNVRDWLTFEPFQVDGYLYMDITVHGLISPAQAGNNKGLLLKLDNDMKIVNETWYEHNDIGNPFDTELLGNGVFAISSEKGEKIYLSVIDNEGTMTTTELTKEGKYLQEYDLIPTTNKDYLFCGIYSETGWSDKTNVDYNGFFIQSKGQPITYISFASLAEASNFSPTGYKKRNDGKAAFQVYYDKKSENVIFAVYNTGKTTVARLGIIIYDVKTGGINANETELLPGTYGFRKIRADNESFFIHFYKYEEKTTSAMDLVISKNDITNSEWVAGAKLNLEGNTIIEYWCRGLCENNYFLKISDKTFSILR